MHRKPQRHAERDAHDRKQRAAALVRESERETRYRLR